jgi:lambda family phage portal protein
MNAFDSLIASISPQAALKRQRARLQLEALRRYDGAGRGRRTDGWRVNGTSADAAAAPGLSLLRDRSRDLVRNNPYAAKAVNVIVANTVGTGIMCQLKARRSRRRSEQMTAIYQDWATDPLQCDYHGRHDLYGLQALALRTVVESGEVLIRRRTARSSSGQRVPLHLQLMEPDLLDASHDGPHMDGGHTRNGIVFDSSGRVTHYWLWEVHPGENQILMKDFRSTKVAAREIIHVFRQDRPHQTRGVPWASPVIIRLRDYDDYSDAQLLKQKISACFAGFVVDTEAADGGSGELVDKLEPGSLEILPPGKDVRFANPPTVGEFGQITREYLLQIAAGFGVTYESLTGDLSHTSFASGRLGWLEFQRNIEAWRWQMLVPQMLNPIWRWFAAQADINGLRTDGIVPCWTPPRRELIDPSKEIEATKKAVRSGFMSLSEAIREFGYEPEEVLQEIAEDARLIDQLGLKLDSDPRATSAAGQPVQPDQAGQEAVGDDPADDSE